jgi:hypothetical protein
MQSCRLLAFVLVASIVLSIFWAVPFPTVKAYDGQLPPGWLSGYTYRKKHTVIGSAGAGMNYQVKFRVYMSSGTDAGNTVYLGGKCKTDFSDVRFADPDGNIFSYWIQTLTADYADIWVKVGSDLSVDQNIYIYYGNPDIQSQSDFDATFVFGETWSSSTLNTSKWTVDGGTVSIDTGQRKVTLYTPGTLRTTGTNLVFPSNFKIEKAVNDEPVRLAASSSASSNGEAYFGLTDGGGRGIIFFGTYRYWYNPTSSYTWKRIAGVGHNIDAYGGDNEGVTDWTAYLTRQGDNYTIQGVSNPLTYSEIYSSSEANRIWLTFSIASSVSFYSFKIRKYVSPEPGHGAWYAEEQATTVAAKLNINVEPSWLSYVAFTLDYPTQILFAPWSSFLNMGSHAVTVLDSKITVNSTYVYGFKCWKKAGEIVSFDKNYTFNLAAGTTDITIVYVAHNVTIVSDPEMYVCLTVDAWQVTTPTTIYRGSGYYNFEALDTQLYYNATHILTFYGWYVDNIYIGSSSTANIYISYNTQIKLAYKAVEIPAPPPMTFKAQIVDLGTVPAGTSKDFAITVIFDATTITIESVEFQAKGEWLQITDTLPMQASRGLEAMGTATIQARLTAPQNTQGYYSIPFKVIGKTSDGTTITTASYLTFTITASTQITETTTITAGGFEETIIRLLGNPILLLLLIALIIWLASYSLKKH